MLQSLLVAFALLLRPPSRSIPPACGRSRTIPPRGLTVASAVVWERAAWDATAWEGRSTFDKHQLLQSLLDGSLTMSAANHAAWRGLGYALAADGSTLLAPDGTPCASPPDVLADPDALARFEAALPTDEEEEMESLDVLVDTLHGAALTRALIEEGDADFLARRTLVRWLYMTQDGVAF